MPRSRSTLDGADTASVRDRDTHAHGTTEQRASLRRLGHHRLPDIAAVAGLAILAFVLRVPQLGPPSLWHDDAWVGIVERLDYRDIPTVGLTSPGFTFLVKVWFDLVGFGDVRAQLPAFAFGVVAPPLIYLVLRNRCRSTIAVGAGLVLAFAPHHIEHSGRLKQYTLEVVLSLLMSWTAFRCIDRPASRQRWAVLVGICVCAVLVSFILSPPALIATGAALIASYAAGRRALLVGAVGSGILAGAIASVYVFHIRDVRSDALTEFWRQNYIELDGVGAALSSTADLLSAYLEGVSPLPPLLLAAIMVVPLAVLAAKRPLVAIVTFGPSFAAVGMSAAELAPLGGGRTDLYTVGPLLLGVALGLEEALRIPLQETWARARSVAAAVCAVAVVGAALVSYERPRYPPMEIRELVEIIESEREPTDAILVLFPARFAYGLYSDARISVSHQPSAAQYRLTFLDEEVFLGYERAEAAAYGERVWLIANWWDRDGFDDYKATLQAEHGLVPVETWSRSGAELVLYDSPSAAVE